MTEIENITTSQLDILKEIGNIGSGNAATAFSKLLNTRVTMETPSVKIASFEEIIDLVGGADEIIVSIFLRILGDAPGSMFFVLPPKQAEKLVHQITGNMEFSLLSPPFEELGLSVLQEAGNILSGSYLSALADLTHLSLQASVPSLNMDMAGAIITDGLMEVSASNDYAILIDTTIEEFSKESQMIQGHFFLLPDTESFSTIFAALGENMG